MCTSSPSKLDTALMRRARRWRRASVGDSLQHVGGRRHRSSASRVSLNNRAFWIAITACSAKVRSSAIC